MMNKLTPFQLQRGLTLVELMVGIVLGMIISAATLYGYNHASNASKVTNAQSRMNEDAQAALDVLTQQIGLVGFNPDQPNYTVANPRNPLLETMQIRGCDATFSNVAGTTPASLISAVLCPTSTSGPSSIAISYEANRYNTIPTSAGVPTDCVGRALTATSQTVSVMTISTPPTPNTVSTQTVNVYEADNRFYIASSTIGGVTVPSLYCNSTAAGATPQPLVENIEDMRFSFGTASCQQPWNDSWVLKCIRD